MSASQHALKALGRIVASKPWPHGQCPQSILVIKTCCLGDVLLATPTLAALRVSFPHARITVMVGTWSRQMLAGNPAVDAIMDCGSLIGGANGFQFGEWLTAIRSARRKGFDACFVLERSAFLSMLPWLAGIPNRVGLDSGGRGFSLNTRVPCPRGRHEAELYLDTLRAIDIDPGHPPCCFAPSVGDRKRAESLRATVLGKALVAIHPGGGVNPGTSLVAKRWPAELYAALADLLAREGYSVAVVGGEQDRAVADQMLEAVKSDTLDLVGRLSLGETAALFSECRLVIGNDTGPIHLAAAVGVPVVVLYGPTDPAVYHPYGQPESVVRVAVDCSPCFRVGRRGGCTDFRCIEGITVESVWSKVQQRLADTAARQPLGGG